MSLRMRNRGFISLSRNSHGNGNFKKISLEWKEMGIMFVRMGMSFIDGNPTNSNG